MFQISRAALVILLVAAVARGADLSKVEIGKRGKAATAFVEIPGRGSGTGFCIHPSGLFVTNEHVVRGAENSEITVVLAPAQANQRELKARVVRVDQATDLALLRVTNVDDLPSLPLGSTEGIAELTEVIACGFPLGRRLSSDKKEYPAISVNGGSVTALRHKDGELQFIQTDVALNFGNSGGPVLDLEGKVIGVVVSKAADATGINQAIPVSQLDRFLKAPVLSLVPPMLTRVTVAQPQVFKVQAVSFVPGAAEPALKLRLQAGDEQPREFPLNKQDDAWVATALPITPQTRSRVEVSARLGSGTISGTTDDKALKIGGKVTRLSGVRKIDLKPAPTADSSSPPKPVTTLTDETKLQEDISGLDKIEVDVGGQKMMVDVAKVVQLTIQPAADLTFITATVIAEIAGAEVARIEVKLLIHDDRQARRADPESVSITPPELTEDKVVKRLPDAFSDVCLGGGGRYLIFRLPKLKKLAIFDFNEARVTKYIPLAEDNIAFAAGLHSLVIGLRESGKLERWSLKTFERERSAAPPFREEIGSIILGHASNGPLVVNGFFLDLQTYHPLPVRDPKGSERVFSDGYRFPSGDGTVFGAWKTNQSPDESTAFVLEGNVLKRYDEGGLKHVIPGPDGRTIYTALGICSSTLKRFDRDDASYGYCLPAVHGDYFLSLTSASSGKPGLTIYLRGLRQPIAKLDKINHGLSFDGWDRETFGPWRRVFMVPDAQLIAVLPPTNDQVVLYKFDAAAALESSDQDYLIVASQPPPEVKAGATFSYAIKVKSNHLKLTFSIDSGPDGMSVSPEGVVTWTPGDAAKGNQDVILTIKNGGGQEVFHTFTLQVHK